MHYDSMAFSKNGRETLMAKTPAMTVLQKKKFIMPKSEGKIEIIIFIFDNSTDENKK
jgi:hypothetical protein